MLPIKWPQLSLLLLLVGVFFFLVYSGSHFKFSSADQVQNYSSYGFYTSFDSDHGMAVANGTFDVGGQNQVTIRCWSLDELKKIQHFDLFLIFQDISSFQNVVPVEVHSGSLTLKFDAVRTASALWINSVDREQLRQITNSLSAVLYVDKKHTVELKADQLAKIKKFIEATDKLPPDDF